ncbi:MAG TPA: hypothetical protein VGH16_13075 [Candidatus Binatia bacterium]|jgi:hypothetical protein
MNRKIYAWSVMLLLFVSSCSAVQLPRPLSTDETEALSARPLKEVVLGIEWSAHEVYLPDLYRLEDIIPKLTRLKAFKQVGYLENVSGQPDLIMSSYSVRRISRPMQDGFQCFEPMLMVGTFGIIPSVCKSVDEVSFDLRAIGRNESISVKLLVETKSIQGWAALPLKTSENWQGNDETTAYQEEYRDRLAKLLLLEIYRRRAEILKVAR